MVDDSHRPHQRTRPVSNGHPIPAILQLSCCLCKVTILASSDHLFVLRPFFARPVVPRIFSPTLCPSSRRVLRPLSSPLLVVACLLDDKSTASLAVGIDALSRPPSVIYSCLHLVATQPRHETELSRPASLHRSLPSLGSHGFQPYSAWLYS